MQLSLIMYEFFSSSPTFSNTDLAQAIYLASRGSPKLCLALSVTLFIDSLHTHTARTCTHTHTRTHARTHARARARAHLISDHVSPRKNEHTMGMFGVHRRVVCSCWICAICRFHSIALRILGYSKICRLRTHLQIAQIQQLRPTDALVL